MKLLVNTHKPKSTCPTSVTTSSTTPCMFFTVKELLKNSCSRPHRNRIITKRSERCKNYSVMAKKRQAKAGLFRTISI